MMYETCAEVIQAEEEKEGMPLWKKVAAVALVLGVAAYCYRKRRS